MKHFHKLLVGLALFLLAGRGDMFAQLVSSGEWNATTISQDTEVILTGDVTIKGEITVKHLCTLTIKVAEDATKDITISNGFSIANGIMFRVEENAITQEPENYSTGFAKLVIKGTEKARIIIDGGAGYDGWTNDSVLNFAPTQTFHDFAKPTKTLQYVIRSGGIVDLDYVTIQDVSRSTPNSSYMSGAAIEIGFSGSNHFTGPTTLNHCTIQDCYAPLGPAIQIRQQSPNCNPDSSRVWLENTTITRCVSGGANNTNNQGGAIRTYGNVSSNLYLVNCTFSYNHALRKSGYKPAINGYIFEGRANGAALFWNGWGSSKSGGTRCVIEGCLFEHNKSDDCGGAIKTQSSLIFQGKETLIQNNEAPIGAGIYVEGYVGTAPGAATTLVYDLNESLTVRNNTGSFYSLNGVTTPATGAGIHFEFNKDAKSSNNGMDQKLKQITININGATIESNTTLGTNGGDVTVLGQGGGIFINDNSWSTCNVDINLNHGTIKGNKATSGGGMYMEKGTVASTKVGNNTLSISENQATKDGGGIFIDSGNLTVANGVISGNRADGNGAGICMQNGTVTITAGEVKENVSQEYGGGLYVGNTSTTENEVKFTGGSFVNNNALYGGGVCINGAINLTIDNVEIAENKATNGGGVCLLDGAKMNFGKGEIKNNLAETMAGEKDLESAYQKSITEVHGIGGGIYLDSNTQLKFTQVSSMGLYSNMAGQGADDIFANGNETVVLLPKVSNMNLAGLPGAADLKWMEDYIVDDTYYDKGTKIKGSDWDSDKTNERYRNSTSTPYEVKVEEATLELKSYVSLALGYQIIYVTLRKKGLDKGESAIFHFKSGDDDGFHVILTGDGNEWVEKKVVLSVGEWTVTETNWSWAYDVSSPENKSITQNIIDVDKRTFEFTNTRKTEDLPMHHEDIKTNKMGN